MDQIINAVSERTFKSNYHKEIWEAAEKRRKQIRAMRSSGLTWPEIAKVFGVTPQRVQQLGKA